MNLPGKKILIACAFFALIICAWIAAVGRAGSAGYSAPYNIPTFFLETESGDIEFISESKENEEKGYLSVVDSDGTPDFRGSLNSVHVRGNTSFYAPKKNYVLEFDRKERLLGGDSSDKWFLLAQYGDGSKIRTALTPEFVQEYTDLACLDVRYVDVYVNGSYEGLYLLMKARSAEAFGLTDLERINKEANGGIKDSELERVVSDDGKLHAYDLPRTPEDHTGGYMLEVILDYEYEDAYPAFISSHGIYYELKSPDNASLEEVMYIKSYVDEMEAAVYSEDGVNPATGKHFSEYIDVDKWADYYLVKEGLCDGDVTLNVSVYMMKDAGADTKLVPGPVWDVDTVLGTFRPSEYSYMTDPEFLNNMLIYADGLLAFGEVKELVANRIETKLIPWYENEMKDEINALYSEMYDSLTSDRNRWNHDEYMDYADTPEGNAYMIYDFMGRRCDFLKSYFIDGDTWHTVVFFSQGNVHKMYMVRDGEPLKYVPDPLNFFGIFAGWEDESGNLCSLDEVTVTSDMTFEARFIGAEEILKR